MSQWTHIRGGLELTSSPYEFKEENKKYGDDNAYLPFPDKQMKLNAPMPTKYSSYNEQMPTKPYSSYNEQNDKKIILEFNVYVYSLPRAEKYIKEAFNLLPQGEQGWTYSINQDTSNLYSASNCFNYSCEQEQFEKEVTKMYHSNDSWESYDYEKLKELYDVDLSFVNYIDGIVLGIRNDIRYCSGEELLEGLEKFFTYLLEKDIYVEDGYLEWEDEYVLCGDNPYYYCWKKSRITSDFDELFSFKKIDCATNKVLWEKSYRRPGVKGINEETKEETYEVDWSSKNYIVKETTFEDK